tara:strand:- start:83 stop:1126 length:1044 start_codon:yes stop_codon:yes gene_type:complete
MKKRFNFWTKISILIVYLVIATGGIVRMTGSGMGCPDWPKCFGYYIPPTNITELTWMSQKIFKKGQMIIYEDELQISKKNFLSGTVFNPKNWEGYTKHDYSKFNPLHTWVEFINRLIGVICGISVLILGFYSLQFFKNKSIISLLSLLTITAVGFQAWLGKIVVDSNLNPYSITIHMLMALLIISILIFIYSLNSNFKKNNIKNITLKNIVLLSLIFTIIQIVIGTQVREFIDQQIIKIGETNKNLWLLVLPSIFLTHRSFSLLILTINFFIIYLSKKMNLKSKIIFWILGIIAAEIILGIAMYYLHFPFSSQPLHLLLATILFGVQFYFYVSIKNINQKNIEINTE